MKLKQTFNYNRIICLCCFLFIAVNIGFPSTSFSVYQPYIVALPGMSDSLGSLVIGLRALISALSMLLVGRYYRALDCRRGIFIACLCTAFGFFLYGFADGFAMLLAGSVFAGAGYGLGGMIGMTLLITRWFENHIGTAVGFSAVGSGISSIVVPVVAVQIIASFSLQAAFWAEGGVALIVGIVVFALLRNRPLDYAQRLERQIADDKRAAVQAHEQAVEQGIQEKASADGLIISPHANKLMLLAMFFVGAVCVSGFSYFAILLTSSQFDHVTAAGLVSLGGICLTASKFLTGIIFDKFGTRRGTIMVFTLVVAGLVLCCFAPLHSFVLAAMSAICMGAGLAIGTVGIPLWSIELSTTKGRAVVVRNYQLAYAVGGFVFNLVPGPLMDLCGNYVVSYVLLASFGVAAAAIIVSVYNHSQRVLNSQA